MRTHFSGFKIIKPAKRLHSILFTFNFSLMRWLLCFRSSWRGGLKKRSILDHASQTRISCVGRALHLCVFEFVPSVYTILHHHNCSVHVCEKGTCCAYPPPRISPVRRLLFTCRRTGTSLVLPPCCFVRRLRHIMAQSTSSSSSSSPQLNAMDFTLICPVVGNWVRFCLHVNIV